MSGARQLATQLSYAPVPRRGLRPVRSTTNYSSPGAPPVLREVLLTSRQAMGLTQEGLSERSGVSVRTIRNLEAGVITSPRESTTELLFEALSAGASPSGLARCPLRPGPHGQDRLIGRERDLEHVDGAVQRSRVVVLTGPGGVGKTRLATEFGNRAFDAFQHGVSFVRVGTLAPDRPGERGEARVRAEIDAALARDVPDPGVLTAPPVGPKMWSTRKCDLLLIIDNAEHVLGSTAQVVQALLAEMPGVHMLVTSRRPLPVTVAQHWEVRPLAFDRSLGQSGSPAAVELFLQRAEASCPTLDLSRDLSTVASLCRRLDGLPFALELAAARIRSVPIGMMLTGEPVSRVLGGADFDGLPHQGSLFDSIRWSYDLLTGQERAVLHQLTRFCGHFTFQEAQECMGDTRVPGADMLAALVDSSLLQVARGANYRYRLANAVREFLDSTEPVTR
jgi:predicted ATPase